MIFSKLIAIISFWFQGYTYLGDGRFIKRNKLRWENDGRRCSIENVKFCTLWEESKY